MSHTRRALLQSLSFVVAEPLLFAASDFWNKKQPGEWSAAEVQQLITKSPWAKKVRGEMESGGPSVGPIGGGGGGRRGGGGGAMGSADEGEGGGGGGGGGRGGGGGADLGGGSAGRGAPQAPEVVIRWESAKPISEAVKLTLPPTLENHYAVGIVGLPPNYLMAAGRGGGRGRGRGRGEEGAPQEDPAARQKVMIDRIKASAALTCKGKDPQTADLLLQTADQQTIIFGFRKDGLNLAAADKEVTFTFKLMATFKAKFELKDMTYGGQLAL
jgi:hypothetical protein